MIITSSSDEKLERARALGADETINYKKNPEWEKEVLRLTGGNGVDIVLEVGGAETFPRSMSSVRASGQIVVIGVLTGVAGTVPLGLIGHSNPERARRLRGFGSDVRRHESRDHAAWPSASYRSGLFF